MKTVVFFFALLTLVMFSACETNTVEPVDPATYEMKVGETFYRDFILDLVVEGVRYAPDPLANELNDDPHAGELTGCLGPSDVVGWGYGTSENEFYQTRTNFVYNAMTHASSGKIKLEYENPNGAFVFEIYGFASMDHGYHDSDDISFPVRMISATNPFKGKFIGNLYIDDPDILHCISDDVVRVPAHIKGEIYPY